MTSYFTNYRQLVETEAAKRGLRLVYSCPSLVPGSATPPPSSLYPGTTCYYVSLWIGDRHFHGFGPTGFVARAAAEFEAYKELSKRDHLRPGGPKDPFASSAEQPSVPLVVPKLQRQLELSERDAQLGRETSGGYFRPHQLTGVNFNNNSNADIDTLTGDSSLQLPLVHVSADLEIASNCTGEEEEELGQTSPYETEEPPDWDKPTRNVHWASEEIPAKKPSAYSAGKRSVSPNIESVPAPFKEAPPPSHPSPRPVVEEGSPPAAQRRPCPYYVPKTAEEAMNTLICSAINPSHANTDSSSDEESSRSFGFSPSVSFSLNDTLLSMAARKGYLVCFEISKLYRVGLETEVKAKAGPFCCTVTHRKKSFAKKIVSKRLLSILRKQPDRQPPIWYEDGSSVFPSPPASSDASPLVEVNPRPVQEQQGPVDQLRMFTQERGWASPEYSIHSYSHGSLSYCLCTVRTKQYSGIGMGKTEELSKTTAAANVLSSLRYYSDMPASMDCHVSTSLTDYETELPASTLAPPPCSANPSATVSSPWDAGPTVSISSSCSQDVDSTAIAPSPSVSDAVSQVSVVDTNFEIHISDSDGYCEASERLPRDVNGSVLVSLPDTVSQLPVSDTAVVFGSDAFEGVSQASTSETLSFASSQVSVSDTISLLTPSGSGDNSQGSVSTLGSQFSRFSTTSLIEGLKQSGHDPIISDTQSDIVRSSFALSQRLKLHQMRGVSSMEFQPLHRSNKGRGRERSRGRGRGIISTRDAKLKSASLIDCVFQEQSDHVKVPSETAISLTVNNDTGPVTSQSLTPDDSILNAKVAVDSEDELLAVSLDVSSSDEDQDYRCYGDRSSVTVTQDGASSFPCEGLIKYD